MRRIVQLDIGDTGGDGHSMTESILVRVSGLDVSDESLLESRLQAETSSGILLRELCAEYEDNHIKVSDLETLSRAGVINLHDERFYTDNANYYSRSYFRVNPDEFAKVFNFPERVERMDSVPLMMGYLGFMIPDFKWKRLNFDRIMGNSDSPLSWFGYGLFLD